MNNLEIKNAPCYILVGKL